MNKHKSKIAMAIIAMLISSYTSAQVSDQQIKDFFASNPTAEQIAATAASYGMTASQVSAAMGVANYGGSQAAREASISSWVANQSNGYSWNAQGQLVKGVQSSVPDPVGVNQASQEQGVWSPVERRWVSNNELRSFGATNPSQEQMMQQAIKLGLNPQAINYAAYVISGASNVRDQNYANLVNKLNNSMYTGQYGYGYDDSFSQGAGLVKGNGTVHYKMPDGSEVSVRIHNGVPDQTYAQALAEHTANTQQGSQSANASVPIPVAQSSTAYQSPPYAQQQTQQGSAGSAASNAATQIVQSAGQTAVVSSANRVCPAGMTITMARSGIRKCVGSMIREIPAEIPIPKGGLQQPSQTHLTHQTQEQQQVVRVETIQAHEYVGGQNGALTSNQGFLAIEGTGGLEPNPGYRMPGMRQIPNGYIKAEPNWPGAMLVEGIGWIAPNGKDLPAVETGGVMPPPWIQPETGGVTPTPWVQPATGGVTPTPWVQPWPNGFIKAQPDWPGAKFVEGLGWIAPNGKAPAIINSQSGTSGGYYIGPSGLKQPLNLGGNSPGMGAGGPNPGVGQNNLTGNLVPNGPGMGAGGPNPGLGQNTGTGGLEPNPNSGNQWISGGSGGMKPDAR